MNEKIYILFHRAVSMSPAPDGQTNGYGGRCLQDARDCKSSKQANEPTNDVLWT